MQPSILTHLFQPNLPRAKQTPLTVRYKAHPGTEAAKAGQQETASSAGAAQGEEALAAKTEGGDQGVEGWS
jgi:hypothetical protein